MLSARAEETAALTPAEKGYTSVAGNDYRTANGPAPANMLTMYNDDSTLSGVKARFYNGAVGIVTHVKGQWGYVYMAGIKGYVQMNQLVPVGTAVKSAMPEAVVTDTGGALLEMDVGGSIVAHVPYRTNLTVLGLTGNQAVVAWGGMEWMVKVTDLSFNAASSSLVTTTPPPSYPQATETPFVFTGPVGYHDKADWPFAQTDKVAAVTNPNTSHRLNLRVEPTKNSKSLGKYYNGVLVTLEGDVFKNEKGEEWVKVSIGNLTGYMDASFLTFQGGNEAFPASVMPVMQVKNYNSIGNLHLRQKQTMDSASLGLFDNGTRVILMGFTGEWAHVIVNGQMGFMMAKYLK